MKIIPLASFETDSNLQNDIKELLENDKLVCFPTPTGYKLAAALGSQGAVMSVLQAKRRVKNAPSLVLVPDETWVASIASEVPETASILMRAFWPGPLTLLFPASEELPQTVRKALTKAKGWLGIRVPDDKVSVAILKAFDRPLLVTSANLAKKHGANSASQVRKNFGRTVEMMIDSGDIAAGVSSTLVDMTNGMPSVIRAGAISEAEILSALNVA